jgi:hypothetical protein
LKLHHFFVCCALIAASTTARADRVFSLPQFYFESTMVMPPFENDPVTTGLRCMAGPDNSMNPPNDLNLRRYKMPQQIFNAAWIGAVAYHAIKVTNVSAINQTVKVRVNPTGEVTAYGVGSPPEGWAEQSKVLLCENDLYSPGAGVSANVPRPTSWSTSRAVPTQLNRQAVLTPGSTKTFYVGFYFASQRLFPAAAAPLYNCWFGATNDDITVLPGSALNAQVSSMHASYFYRFAGARVRHKPQVDIVVAQDAGAITASTTSGLAPLIPNRSLCDSTQLTDWASYDVMRSALPPNPTFINGGKPF